jgi:hypothetical protein
MSVLMSHSQALKLAAAMRKTSVGLIRIGVRGGSPYVEHKPPDGKWSVVVHLGAPRIKDADVDPDAETA